jgi:hypothetical protein
VVEDITTDRALPAPTPAEAVVAPAAVEVGPQPPPEPAEPLFWRLSTGMALLGFWARRLIHSR